MLPSLYSYIDAIGYASILVEPIKILIVKISPQNCLCVKVEISKFCPAINLHEADMLLYKWPELIA